MLGIEQSLSGPRVFSSATRTRPSLGCLWGFGRRADDQVPESRRLVGVGAESYHCHSSSDEFGGLKVLI